MPAGDIYGAGAPTGIAFYENGALGEKFNGTLLSCEAARNVIFGYQPQQDGAGFKLDRTDFLTTNPEKQFDGADFTGGAKKQARYRWSWEKKFNRTLNDDYTRLFSLVDAMNAPGAGFQLSPSDRSSRSS